MATVKVKDGAIHVYLGKRTRDADDGIMPLGAMRRALATLREELQEARSNGYQSKAAKIERAIKDLEAEIAEEVKNTKDAISYKGFTLTPSGDGYVATKDGESTSKPRSLDATKKAIDAIVD